MISRVRTVMDEMLLYNIKIVVHSLAAEKTREALLELVYKKEVVCFLFKLVWLYPRFLLHQT